MTVPANGKGEINRLLFPLATPQRLQIPPKTDSAYQTSMYGVTTQNTGIHIFAVQKKFHMKEICSRVDTVYQDYNLLGCDAV